MMWNANKTHTATGFSLLELIVVVSIVGILSSIALVNLSSSQSKSRLLAITKDLENWLSKQRSFAKSHNLTCLITIDSANRRLTSTRFRDEDNQPCTGNESDSKVVFFDIAENYGNGSEKLSLISTPSVDPAHSDGGILFSLQGFSQNHQLQSNGIVELRLTHDDLQQQRCIRIISPIGMIRDGRTQGNDPQCRYDKTN